MSTKTQEKYFRSNAQEFETIECPVCGHAEYETVYQSYQETGFTLGRILANFVVCMNCWFMYQNPRPRFDTLDKHYSESEQASGSVYHDARKDSCHAEKQRSRLAFYKKYFDEINNGSLLEVGCSTGDFLFSLDLPGWNLTGLEPSLKAVSQAKAYGLDVICASLENSNLADESYDVISCFSVLEHLHDINSAMHIMTRKLKKNGILCLEVPDTLKPVPQISEFFTFEHMSHFTSATLTCFLKRYGYSDIEFDSAVKDSRLRICARKTGDITSRSNINDLCKNDVLSADGKILITKIQKYKNEKNKIENVIKNRLATHVSRWKEQKKKVAIYGAGLHTRYLMNLFDLTENIIAIIDSDPDKNGKSYLRWTISDETLLASGEVDAVIISSKAFEDEIYSRIEKYSKENDIEIVRCYGANSMN